MAARSKTYRRITREEFDAFMDDLVPDNEVVRPDGVSERVYDCPLPSDRHVIRVFSTIEGGAGRDRGADAIRCVIWDLGANEPVSGRLKTLRIDTWRDNLRAKIEDLYANWRDEVPGRCPECGGALAVREPGPGDDWDTFAACTAWDGGDGCDHTEKL